MSTNHAKRLSRILPSLILLGIGILFLIGTTNIRDPGLSGDPGPKLAPLVSGVGLVLCGIVLLLQTFFQAKSSKPVPASNEPRQTYARTAGILTLYIIGYCAALYTLGFILSTPVLLFFALGVIGTHKPRMPIRIVFSILTTGIVFLVFETVLHVMLPSGLVL